MAKENIIDIIADPVEKIACRKCGRHLDVSKLASFSKVECPDCHTVQTVPAQLGAFLLLELLGQGGMGAVYKALDKQLGRYVAIKVMKQSLGDDQQFVENFMREARAAAAINHRNVVQIYSCGQEKGQPYIVMELVSGGRFDDVVASGNPLDEVRALEVGVDVAEGLKAANDIGLIHGDVKPANVLFDKDGVAKVADFGLARFVKWQQERGEVWGTPYYIAPEKARAQKVDHRSDIYSLGATLYHALGAKPPFDGKTATDVVLARLKNPAIGLRVIRPSLQPETADVIARMLEADPFMRYPTYASLLADMREALRVAKQEQRAVRTKVKKSPAGPFVAVFFIVLALVAAVLGVLQWLSIRRQQAAAEPATTVIATEPQVSPEDVIQETLDEPLPPLKTVAVVQPFTTTGEKAIADAVRKLVDGKPDEMLRELQKLYEESPAIGMGRYWLRLFQALACWAAGHDQDALAYLMEVRNALFEAPDSRQPHPGNMPQAIARFTLKELDEGGVTFEAARWPAWFGDFAEFFMGADYLREGNLKRAGSYFESYVSKDGTDPAWPYSLRPVARMCLDQMAKLNEVRERVAVLIEQKQAAKARSAMEGFRFRASPLLFPVVDHEMSLIARAEAREADEQKRTERRAHEEQVQQDLDRLDEVRTANLPLVARKDYRRAAAALTKLIPQMKTREGQQTLAVMRESYNRMDALKKFLINRITGSPYRGAASELGGDAVSADLNGIRVALGQHGMMVKPWEEVSLRLFLQLARHYTAETGGEEPERADMTLNMAVLCYENGIFNWAATFAGQAVKQDSQLKTAARKLMPDLLPD